MGSGTWIEEQIQRAGELQSSELVYPEAELGPEEKVVGKMTPLHLGLFTLMRQAEEERERLGLDLRWARDEAAKEVRRQLVEESAAEFQLLRDCFWTQLRKDLDAWNSDIGVRRGGEVVVFEHPSSLASFLELITGSSHPEH